MMAWPSFDPLTIGLSQYTCFPAFIAINCRSLMPMVGYRSTHASISVLALKALDNPMVDRRSCPIFFANSIHSFIKVTSCYELPHHLSIMRYRYHLVRPIIPAPINPIRSYRWQWLDLRLSVMDWPIGISKGRFRQSQVRGFPLPFWESHAFGFFHNLEFRFKSEF